MTTRKQVAANITNARKSTGPMSGKGKATSSKNAQKHGLTTPPDWHQVTSWYRIIMADPDAVTDALSTDGGARAALTLAEAEASRERAARAEADHLWDMSNSTLSKGNRSLADLAELDLNDIETLDFLIERTTEQDLRAVLQMMKQKSPNRPAAQRDTLKRLRRYRREAEARRRKALRAWIEIQNANPETKPISPKVASNRTKLGKLLKYLHIKTSHFL
jgi:hypothetical protein